MEIIKHQRPFLRTNKEVQLEYFADPDWKNRVGRHILVTGTYDMLTVHHAQAIRTAKNIEPNLSLVLALDSDEYTKRRKGSLRPIIPYEARRYLLAEFEFVDWILKHDGDNDRLIRTIEPSYFGMSYATAQECPEDRIADMQAVDSVGGKVLIMPAGDSYHVGQLAERLDTSAIVREIARRYGEQLVVQTNGNGHLVKV